MIFYEVMNQCQPQLQLKDPQFEPTLNTINKCLHKEKFSILNRLKSIFYDHSYVTNICSSSHLQSFPIIANKRCGLWYVQNNINKPYYTCYFKSTDGHYGYWSFNHRRLNPNVIQLLSKFNGAIIIDSTRTGKQFPDALQRTIPIWCYIINCIRIKCNDSNAKLPSIKMPDWILESEREQIERLAMDEWIPNIMNKGKDSIFIHLKKLILQLPSMIECHWITNNGKNSLDFGEIIKNRNTLPLFLISASSTNISKQLSFAYIQGAGDDCEHWSFGLTPHLFWMNYQRFLSFDNNVECEEYIKYLLETKNVREKKTNENGISVNWKKWIEDNTILMNEQKSEMKNIRITCNIVLEETSDIIVNEYEANCNRFLIIIETDLEMVEKYKMQIANENNVKIGIYFISECKKYKHSLYDAMGDILSSVCMSSVREIWIHMNSIQYDINLIGCVYSTIILSLQQLERGALTKSKIRTVMNKLQFHATMNEFHPSRLLLKQINRYFLSC